MGPLLAQLVQAHRLVDGLPGVARVRLVARLRVRSGALGRQEALLGLLRPLAQRSPGRAAPLPSGGAGREPLGPHHLDVADLLPFRVHAAPSSRPRRAARSVVDRLGAVQHFAAPPFCELDFGHMEVEQKPGFPPPGITLKVPVSGAIAGTHRPIARAVLASRIRTTAISCTHVAFSHTAISYLLRRAVAE